MTEGVDLPEWLRPRLLDSEQMRALDSWAIESRGIPSLDLMERAGRGLGEAVAALAPRGPVRVVCGRGNNGGDGLVAARRLAELGIPVDVVLIADPEDLSPDAAVNLERLGAGWRTVGPAQVDEALLGSAIVIDAILGTGFAGVPREPVIGAIRAINRCPAPAVSADIASGVDASTGAAAPDPELEGELLAVDAARTVTFHAAKVGHYVAPGKWLSGEVEVLAIGIPDEDPGAPGRPNHGLIDRAVLTLAPRRGARSTKFSSGRVLVIGASPGLTGAVCLAAGAAIRAGAGYATVAVPAAVEPIIEAKLTEQMSIGLADEDGRLTPAALDAALDAAEGGGAVLVGPGLGGAEGSLELARQVCMRIPGPLVVDADGLNAFAGRAGELSAREAPTVLTPHAGELGRLLGIASPDISAARLERATEAARVTEAVVVLKGDDTIVTDGDRVAINDLSAPGLATAGTGDVLAGAITGLLARGMDPFEAACAGVISHARAGLAAADRLGSAESVIASDVVAALPQGLAGSADLCSRGRLSTLDG